MRSGLYASGYQPLIHLMIFTPFCNSNKAFAQILLWPYFFNFWRCQIATSTLLLPQFFHILQSSSFCLWDHLPYKKERKHTHDSVEAVCECSTELHHGRIGGRNEIVRCPLSGNGYG